MSRTPEQKPSIEAPKRSACTITHPAFLIRLILQCDGSRCRPRLKHAAPIRSPPRSGLLAHRVGHQESDEGDPSHTANDDTGELRVSEGATCCPAPGLQGKERLTAPTLNPLPATPPLPSEVAEAAAALDLELGLTEVTSDGLERVTVVTTLVDVDATSGVVEVELVVTSVVEGVTTAVVVTTGAIEVVEKEGAADVVMDDEEGATGVVDDEGGGAAEVVVGTGGATDVVGAAAECQPKERVDHSRDVLVVGAAGLVVGAAVVALVVGATVV